MSDPTTPEPRATEGRELSVAAESSTEKNSTVEVASHHPQNIEEDENEPQPHLHAKTFLAVFAVCLIYFAQDFALVGAGAVSYSQVLLFLLRQVYLTSLSLTARQYNRGPFWGV